MKKKLFRTGFLLASLLFSISSFAKEKKCWELDPPDTSCKRCLPEYASLHSSLPCVTCCHNPCYEGIVSASFLVWQAKEDGLIFAVDNTAPSASPNLNINAHNISPDFSWEPAFKVAIGAAFPSCDWDLIAGYTFFYSTTNTSATASKFTGGAGLEPTWNVQDFLATTLFNKANSHWKLHFHSLDLSLGHDFFISKHLSLRFHGGLKGLIVNQRYLINYSSNSSVFTEIETMQTKLHNNSRGIGPRVGCESKWYFPGCGGHLLANIAAATVLQQFRFSLQELQIGFQFPGLDRITDTAQIRNVAWLWRPCLETLLGYGWGFCFGRCKNNYFGFQVAYEAQFFWEQNLLYRITDFFVAMQGVQSKGDLLLQGGTLTFQWDF